MKQLLIAAAVTLTLASVPVLADTTDASTTASTVGNSITPVDQNQWHATCALPPFVIYVGKGKHTNTYLIKVQEEHRQGPPTITGHTHTIQGGEAAIVICNGSQANSLFNQVVMKLVRQIKISTSRTLGLQAYLQIHKTKVQEVILFGTLKSVCLALNQGKYFYLPFFLPLDYSSQFNVPPV